ncbi:MAG: ABC transporter, permease protein 2 (cluster 5, nickel/peptides/opines), partial [uncultured Craurococcus sp.]
VGDRTSGRADQRGEAAAALAGAGGLRHRLALADARHRAAGRCHRALCLYRARPPQPPGAARGDHAAPARHRRAGAGRALAPDLLDPHEPADRLRGDHHRRADRHLARRAGGAFPRPGRAGGPRPGRFLGEPALPHPGARGARLLRQFADALHLPARPACLGALCADRARPRHQRRRAGLRGGGAAARRLALARLWPSCAAEHRLDADRLDDARLPRDHPARERPLLPRPRRAAAGDLARLHGRLRTGISHPCSLDPALAGGGDRADDLLRLGARRLAARPARPDPEL